MAEEEVLIEDAGKGEEDIPPDEEEDEAESEQQAAEIMADETMSNKDKILRLYDLGYNRRQIVEDFGFKLKTVYDAMPVKKEKKQTGTAMMESSIFPVTRKTEQISVENIFQYLSNGDEHMKYRYEGMLMLKAAMLMVADQANIDKINAQTEMIRIKPLLEMVNISRQELDAAAARSKDSQFAIARAAASQAVGSYVNEIDKHLPKAPAAPPAREMSEIMPRALGKVVDRVMDVAVDNFLAKISPGSAGGGKSPEGWEEEVRPAPPATATKEDGWAAETRQAEGG